MGNRIDTVREEENDDDATVATRPDEPNSQQLFCPATRTSSKNPQHFF